ncbi:MAG: hypothetical protein RL654_3415 [Pseudomonadota bacterium]|jgi:peptidoglycan/LPS O-acetylase OafA/YrhL
MSIHVSTGIPSFSSRHSGSSSSQALPLVDLGKALASQLIVWHHLALYGPMCDVAEPLAPALRDGLVEQGRLAVQVFLVMAGFLAARSMLPHPAAEPRVAGVMAAIGRRFMRLAEPYWVALLAAVCAAWIARGLIAHPTIPEAPTLLQGLAHLLMVQDVAGLEALSAGVWYVAIDLQLFALVALLCGLRRGLARPGRSALTVALLLAGITLSLLLFNRDRDLDVWAIYFVGAYGLGMLAHWAVSARRPVSRIGWLLAILMLTGLALWLDWRERILLAGTTALLLALLVPLDLRLPAGLTRPAARLSHISYTVFLLHYPVLLLTGALIGRLWPDAPQVHALGLLLAWALSLLAGQALQSALDRREHARRQARRPQPFKRPVGVASGEDQRTAVPG